MTGNWILFRDTTGRLDCGLGGVPPGATPVETGLTFARCQERLAREGKTFLPEGKAATRPPTRAVPLQVFVKRKHRCVWIGDDIIVQAPGCNSGALCTFACEHDEAEARGRHPRAVPAGNCQSCPDYEESAVPLGGAGAG